MSDVVGIGEASIDCVYHVAGELEPDAKLRIAASRVSAGGQVATTMCACAALGLKSAFAGTLGNDDHARQVRAALHARGVDISAAQERPAPTRRAVIIVDARGRRSVFWERAPELALRREDLDPRVITSGRCLHVDDVDLDASLAAATMARAAGIPVTSDLDTAAEGTMALVEAVSVPIFAQRVPEALTGENDPERALRTLQRPHHTFLCVTLGREGALLIENDTVHRVGACPVDPVDTTGAGDVFRGAFIYALLRGDTPADILRFATAAAAVSVTREGAIDSVPTLADVERMLGAI